MTLVSEIISDAYRESNLIAVGASPTSNEQTEGLRLLNRFIASVYGIEVGEEFQPVIIGRNNIDRPTGYPDYDQVPNETDWFVPQNSRLILNLTAAQTVFLDPNPEDGARFALIDKSGNLATYNLTVDANGRTIGSANSLTVSTNSAIKEYFYRADTGDWSLVSPLDADDTFPFPTEFEDLFVIGLAIRINPRHGAAISAESGSTYARLMKIFKARYRQFDEIPVELGLIKLPSNRYGNYDTRMGNRDFTMGRPR